MKKHTGKTLTNDLWNPKRINKKSHNYHPKSKVVLLQCESLWSLDRSPGDVETESIALKCSVNQLKSKNNITAIILETKPKKMCCSKTTKRKTNHY